MATILDCWHSATPFAAANPVYFLGLCHRYAGHRNAKDLIELLSKQVVLGDSQKIRDSWQHCAPARFAPSPYIELPRHVFPVFLDAYDVAMLVPLHFRRAEDWSAPDVLAGLGPSSPSDGLMELLAKVEYHWAGLQGRKPLPLRWRTPFAISAGCHLYFQNIRENSFELPLLVALLRELCAASTRPSKMPFGDGPVFATGTLGEGAKFGAAGSIEHKLAAFVREAPGMSPVLLAPFQYEYLKKRAPDLLDLVRPVEIESEAALLQLDEFREGLDRLSGPPHPSEIDELLWKMDRLARSERFQDTQIIADWLLPYVGSPGGYRARLLIHGAAAALHQDRMVEWRCHSSQLRELVTCCDLGADQKVRCASQVAIDSYISADWEDGLEELARVEGDLIWCSEATKVRYFGVRSRLLRALKRCREAMQYAEQAFALAQRADGPEAGMHLNLLIHALLRKAEANDDMDLARASHLLEESAGRWTPIDDESRRQSHVGFCCHLAAERARIAGEPHAPLLKPGNDRHPRLFELLACARNSSNDQDLRIIYAETLVTATDRIRGTSLGLYKMLSLVYRVYLDLLRKEAPDAHVAALRQWCRESAQLGLGGWEPRLGPLLDVETHDLLWVERLCQVVPHH